MTGGRRFTESRVSIWKDLCIMMIFTKQPEISWQIFYVVGEDTTIMHLWRKLTMRGCKKKYLSSDKTSFNFLFLVVDKNMVEWWSWSRGPAASTATHWQCHEFYFSGWYPSIEKIQYSMPYNISFGFWMWFSSLSGKGSWHTTTLS